MRNSRVILCVCVLIGRHNEKIFDRLDAAGSALEIQITRILSLSLPGRHISAHPGHCVISAEDDKPHSHHDGPRTLSHREFKPLDHLLSYCPFLSFKSNILLLLARTKSTM